jgi:hypothetical protein
MQLVQQLMIGKEKNNFFLYKVQTFKSEVKEKRKKEKVIVLITLQSIYKIV